MLRPYVLLGGRSGFAPAIARCGLLQPGVCGQKRIIFCLLPLSGSRTLGRIFATSPFGRGLTSLRQISSSRCSSLSRPRSGRRPCGPLFLGAPLRALSVRRIVALGPRCPFRLCASCRARLGPAPSVARLFRPVCLTSPAPLPGCGRIAWPKRGQLRPSWPTAKEHLAPCWAGGLCVHSRQALFRA